jgi:hypothetical protein
MINDQDREKYMKELHDSEQVDAVVRCIVFTLILAAWFIKAALSLRHGALEGKI